jgi:hypothetical protein
MAPDLVDWAPAGLENTPKAVSSAAPKTNERTLPMLLPPVPFELSLRLARMVKELDLFESNHGWGRLSREPPGLEP